MYNNRLLFSFLCDSFILLNTLAFIRCTVDGGTNRWRHFLEHNDNSENLKVPDLVVGDFDSITSETRQYFTNGKTKFLHTPDQNATDFTKAVDVVHDILATKEVSRHSHIDYLHN